ncbi:cytochrome c-type biogenesis protein CcmH [Sphingosinicellaceae bacterium]|nr:cytochrome c-type biogenesis protein CcmH [Sphingosinicellaceae bacterium]
MRGWRAGLVTALLLTTPALGVLPSEQLADPVLEARARSISQEIRCVVCQNQSIDDSDAPLAADLRVIVREQLRLGKTDEQAKQYLVSRYGSYVLLRPPLRPDTWLLWLGPFAILGLGGLGVFAYLRSRRGLEPVALTADEQTRLDELIQQDEH